MRCVPANIGLPLLVIMLVYAPAQPATADTDWLIAPYGWLPSISVDQSTDNGGGGISGSDLLSKTEAVFMLRFEAARNRWGMTVDYISLSLADQATRPPRPPLNIGIDIDGELDLDVFEIGGFYRPGGEIVGINYLLGIRQIGADKVILASPSIGPSQRFDSSSDVTDVFLGARYLHRFGKRWDLTFRGDYSFGDSEGTLNLLASIGVRVAGPFGLQLGYRHAVLEFKEDVNGVPETTEISLSGSFLGFVFRF